MQDPNKEEVNNKLTKALYNHAIGVTVQLLGKPRPDIANYAMAQAFQKASTFRGESKFSTWFQAIVKNLCRDAQRQEITARERHTSLDAVQVAVTTDAMEAKIHVQQLMAKASAEDRKLMQMKLEGHTEAEIGEALGISRDQVTRWWKEVRRQLGGTDGLDAGN